MLTPQETEELFEQLKLLRENGHTIIFISHKLNEVKALCNRMTILRDGKTMGTYEISDLDEQEISRLMVGRDVSLDIEKEEMEFGKNVFSVKDLVYVDQFGKTRLDHVSFTIKEGQILGIAGIDGNGQTEFVYGLSGLEPLKSGAITMNGKDITHMPIRERLTSGMSHIPEDRHKHGLVLDYSLEDNIVLQRYFEPQFTNKLGFLKRKEIRKYANRLIEQYDIRSGQGAITKARSMSGGNQQKAIIAREIDKNPELLIAVQPTRGLDVGAIEHVHKQLVQARDAGKGVLLISLELDEVMNVSDRILVMYEGEIVGEFDPKKVTVEELGLYMAGSKRKETKSNE